MTEIGAELFTLTCSVIEFHVLTWPGLSSLVYMVIVCNPLVNQPCHSISSAGVTPEVSNPSKSLQNSKRTSSPSGSVTIEPSNKMRLSEVSPARNTSNSGSGISLNNFTSKLQVTSGLFPSER